MEINPIDLFNYQFWLALALGVFLLPLVRQAYYRSLAIAGINLLFLYLILSHAATYVLLALLTLHYALRLGIKKPIYAILFTVILSLFLVSKSPWIATTLGLSQINPILCVIGFSYIALRIYEYISAAADEECIDAASIIDTINYILPFHMLAAGPIQSWDEYVAGRQEDVSTLSFQDALTGVERIAQGLFKKFVLAYLIEEIFLHNFSSDSYYFLLEVQLFYIWLYLDFSAYSDIAAGAGKLMGISTPENFNRPYLARNLTDFWDKWHISLSLFIRRNIFNPIQLTLSRKFGLEKQIEAASVALLISFILCGLWHGLSWQFFAWGTSQAIGQIAVLYYRSFLKKKLGSKGVKQYTENPYIRIVAIIITFEYMAFSFFLAFSPTINSIN